jgi:hypothetical protein
MANFSIDELEIIPCRNGSNEYSKVSYPLRYGQYGEIRTADYIYQFNLNGEIKFIRGRKSTWPDPTEWLKRSVTDDWLYYSSGGYSGTLEYSGEYYVPCTQYRTNSIIQNNPFNRKEVISAIESYGHLYGRVCEIDINMLEPENRHFLEKIKKNPPENLGKKKYLLRNILGDRITVLPPDTRHVDYEVIPVIIADGCLYRCGFCGVKSPKKYSTRPVSNIRDQIKKLKEYYGLDKINYNSLFFAQHDSLNAGIELIEKTALFAYKELEIEKTNIKGANLFFFGSVDSLLKAGDEFFKRLDDLPFMTYINIGLETADQDTLNYISKDITADNVEKAFSKILEINAMYNDVELTSNFLFSDRMPANHYPSIINLIDKYISHTRQKGTIYFSPMFNRNDAEPKGIKRKFFDFKRRIRLPAYLYLIQRL